MKENNETNGKDQKSGSATRSPQGRKTTKATHTSAARQTKSSKDEAKNGRDHSKKH